MANIGTMCHAHDNARIVWQGMANIGTMCHAHDNARIVWPGMAARQRASPCPYAHSVSVNPRRGKHSHNRSFETLPQKSTVSAARADNPTQIFML